MFTMKTEVTYRSAGVNWNNWSGRKEGRSHSSQGITSKARQRFNRCFFFCHLRYVFSYLTFQVSTVVLLVFVQHWLKISRTPPFKTFQRVFYVWYISFFVSTLSFCLRKLCLKTACKKNMAAFCTGFFIVMAALQITVEGMRKKALLFD